MAASLERSAVEIKIRKLRKKLRQIENLECLDHDLTEEESRKVTAKSSIREELQTILAEFPTDTDTFPEHSTRSSIPSETEASFVSAADITDEFEVTDQDGLADNVVTSSIEENLAGEGDNRDVSDVTVNREKGKKNLPDCSKSHKNSNVPLQNTDTDVIPQKKRKTVAGDTLSPLQKQEQEAKKHWSKVVFMKRYLDGHNDLICSVCADDSIAVSGSRDTTVKAWDLKTATEIKNFGGHTGSVTAVLLLSTEESQKYGDVYEQDSSDQIIVSGSTDCSIRSWSLKSGKLLWSVYTYSAVTSMAHVASLGAVVTGSDGGKLEIWSLENGDNIQSLRAHDDAVTSIKVVDNLVFTSCTDGLIKIYELRSNNLHPIFISENIRTSAGYELPRRRICCLAVNKQTVYYGDDGVNIKALSWRKGLVHKVKNHTCEFGATDSLCSHGDILLSSGLDVDSGIGYINMYFMPTNRYLASLVDDDVSRIVCSSCAVNKDGNRLRLVTGGVDLVLWEEIDQAEDNGEDSSTEFVGTVCDTRYELQAVDSEGSDLESDMSDSDDAEQHQRQSRRQSGYKTNTESAGWWSWCSLL